MGQRWLQRKKQGQISLPLLKGGPRKQDINLTCRNVTKLMIVISKPNMKTNHRALLALFLITLCGVLPTGCRKPPAEAINRALAATNATFRTAGIDPIELSAGQTANLKRIVTLFPDHAVVKRTDEDLVADSGGFTVGDVQFGWIGNRLELYAEQENYCFVVTNKSLGELALELFKEEATNPIITSNDWAKMLTVLEKTNSSR